MATEEILAQALDRMKALAETSQELADAARDLATLREHTKPEIIFFGYNESSGHAWQSADGGYFPHEKRPLDDHIDGGYAPKKDDRVEMPQGVCRTVLVGPYTVVSFWDRSGDGRGKSNSSFVARGTFTFEEMVAAAKVQLPWFFERIADKFELRDEWHSRRAR